MRWSIAVPAPLPAATRGDAATAGTPFGFTLLTNGTLTPTEREGEDYGGSSHA